MSANVKVTVISDLACPWCYVGLKRLDKGLAAMPNVIAEKEWHAYLLDWDTPQEGIPLEEAYRKKFGPQAATLKNRIVSAGQEDGANFSNWKWRPNTVKGHMLVALARRHGKSHAANLVLFQKSYEEGKNIGETAVILEAGRQLSLPEDELQAAFGGDELDPELLGEVRLDDELAKERLHVTGVPFFMISSGESKTYALSGAQPPEAFQEAVQRALREAGSHRGDAPVAKAGDDGTSCSREGVCA